MGQATPSFSLATVLTGLGPVACIEVGDSLYPLQACADRLGLPELGQTVLELLQNWEERFPRLCEAAAQVDTLSDVSLKPGLPRLAPILYPGKVLCAGANYFDHLEEMGVAHATDKSRQRLFFFFKPPRQAIVGEGDTVHCPDDCKKFDWEIELALVIGKKARNLQLKDALSHVAAYTVAIDFSARDLNRAPDTFYKLDWVAGKAHDTSCPIGPRLVPSAFVKDPNDLRMRLTVNGDIKQDARTSGMVFDIAEQLVTLSRIMTLDPGDLVLTGTPAGVGAPRGTFLNKGDLVSAAIEGLGDLQVRIQ